MQNSNTSLDQSFFEILKLGDEQVKQPIECLFNSIHWTNICLKIPALVSLLFTLKRYFPTVRIFDNILQLNSSYLHILIFFVRLFACSNCLMLFKSNSGVFACSYCLRLFKLNSKILGPPPKFRSSLDTKLQVPLNLSGRTFSYFGPPYQYLCRTL